MRWWITLVMALGTLACEKDKPTGPPPDILSFFDNGGYNDVDTLGTGPFHAIIISYLTNTVDSMGNVDARDQYDVTLSRNGDLFLVLEDTYILPVPVIVSVGDVDGGYYEESAFGGDQENAPIKRTYYQNRTLRIGVRIHGDYDDPTDPPVDFPYRLRIEIP